MDGQASNYLIYNCCHIHGLSDVVHSLLSYSILVMNQLDM